MEKEFLVFFVEYGCINDITCEHKTESELSGSAHLMTSYHLPRDTDYQSLKEWMNGAAIGEHTTIPNGYYSHIVRVK